VAFKDEEFVIGFGDVEVAEDFGHLTQEVRVQVKQLLLPFELRRDHLELYLQDLLNENGPNEILETAFVESHLCPQGGCFVALLGTE